MPEDSEGDIAQREATFQRVRANPELTRYELAADLYTAAFLLPKVKPASGKESNPEFPGMPLVPVSSHVWRVLQGGQALGQLVGAARQAANFARAFHWPLEFPHILLNQNETRRGFDVVLGNPPWEVMQLGEEEYFALRSPEIAQLSGAKRKKAIAQLEHELPTLYATYISDLRVYQAGNEFARTSGRFDLTARGKVNTYALFAELFSNLICKSGQAGVIVPTGIATDLSTAAFFGSLVGADRLVSFYSFENESFIFANVHHSFKFALLVIGGGPSIEPADYCIFLRSVEQLTDGRRHFRLTSSEVSLINPNTRTAPIFRSAADAKIVDQIYRRVPILIDDSNTIGNPWQISFSQGLFNMTSDSGFFLTVSDLEQQHAVRNGNQWQVDGGEGVGTFIPLYEAKFLQSFDHRAGSYETRGDSRGFRVLPDTSLEQKCDPTYEIWPFYFVNQSEVSRRVPAGWGREWFLAFKDVTSSISERTAIFSVIPNYGVGNNAPLIFSPLSASLMAGLLANLNALAFDYCARTKVGGLHLNYMYLKQLPALPPSAYSLADLAFTASRVLELTYTSCSMTPFARDLGYSGDPFPWDEDRRALLRAELDAWYARAYGLTREDLRYILDPADLLGPDYPSETFRVLKNNEVATFGEYRTQRLVLAAWDRQAAGQPPISELGREPIVLTPAHEVAS
jgi:hypothetical protein